MKMSEITGQNIDRNRRNAYSGSKFLESAIRFDRKYMLHSDTLLSEGIDFEIEREKGGIIVLSSDVNAENLTDNQIVDWVKKRFSTLNNRPEEKNITDEIAKENEFAGWTIGKYLNGRYTSNNGASFSENSLSIEVFGVDFDTFLKFAEQFCTDFKQENVLLKDYSNDRVLFVNND